MRTIVKKFGFLSLKICKFDCKKRFPYINFNEVTSILSHLALFIEYWDSYHLIFAGIFLARVSPGRAKLGLAQAGPNMPGLKTQLSQISRLDNSRLLTMGSHERMHLFQESPNNGSIKA